MAQTRPSAAPIAWGNDFWNLQINPTTGALAHIENKNDPEHMNFLRDNGHWEGRNWVVPPDAITADEQWGLVETSQQGLLHVAKVQQISDHAWEATYSSAVLAVTIRREINSVGDLAETYTFKNTGVLGLNLPLGSVAITAPLFDQYPDARLSLSGRCHVHLWMGGSSAWINAMRMGAQPPHLGLVLTQGSLDAYSQRGGTIDDRGVFLIHPAAMKIAAGRSQTIAWKLFWHQGWDDFFAKLKATSGFVRMSAKDYVVPVGQPLEILADSASAFSSAKVFANGRAVDAHIDGGKLTAVIPTTKPGDVLVEVTNVSQITEPPRDHVVIEIADVSNKTWLRAFVTPPVDDLIDARVKFIVRHQQRNAKSDPLGGAYLAYDNETGEQVYDPKTSDHNAGRERLGMGVLCALYLPLCKDPAFKDELSQSLKRYSDFITRELEDDDGVVYNSVGRKNNSRPYNAPWFADFHLAMYQATGDRAQLDRYVKVLRHYYANGGSKFYAIGIPITDGLKALEDAGRKDDRAELLADFKTHADYFAKNGLDYPRSEVNYEQSIVAPAVEFLAEMYTVTGDSTYLDAARQQMPLLEAFCGQQPDSRLNEVAIRHWDDYWFGKLNVYGDTLPHYWSTINAVAYAYYGIGTKDPTWQQRANTVLNANLSLFNPDGSASCAHLYAFDTNGETGAQNDPWANDQDWALVHLIMVREISKSK